MIIVLGRRNSANVQKVMWCLGELGLEYVREDVAGSFGFPDDYPNPNQVVPTVKDGDITVWESNVCVRYIARTYGAGSLWPDNPKTLALADQWMDWHRGYFSNAFFPLFGGKIRMGKDNDALKNEISTCAAQYQILDEHLADNAYLAGDTLTMGDIPMGTVTYRYMTLDIKRPPLPNVERWYQSLSERPAFKHHAMIWYGTNPEEWMAEEKKNANIQ